MENCVIEILKRFIYMKYNCNKKKYDKIYNIDNRTNVNSLSSLIAVNRVFFRYNRSTTTNFQYRTIKHNRLYNEKNYNIAPSWKWIEKNWRKQIAKLYIESSDRFVGSGKILAPDPENGKMCIWKKSTRAAHRFSTGHVPCTRFSFVNRPLT